MPGDVAPRHLLTVWNPDYASDAMDAHLRVLLDWAERAGRGEAAEEDVYVWWGKIRSSNRREQALPHMGDILALQQQIEAEVETHLYLTDYRSLYVAWLDEITTDDVLAAAADEVGEKDHAPGYYGGRMMDCWFKVLDVRRLVANDTPATIEELKRLRNTRYFDRPVSLYGGIHELPLIVWREEPARWFADRAALTGGKRWVERDAALRGETERMAQELRDNLIGRELWSVLEPATTAFLASAEAVFRTRREDPGFDFSTCALEYAKAVETEVNALVFRPLRRLLRHAGPAEREIHADGHRLDLAGTVPHQSLGTMQTLLQREEKIRKGVRATCPGQQQWILGVLPSALDPLVKLRNPAAHSGTSELADVGRQRAAVLGIGCEGLIVQLARARLCAQA